MEFAKLYEIGHDPFRTASRQNTCFEGAVQRNRDAAAEIAKLYEMGHDPFRTASCLFGGLRVVSWGRVLKCGFGMHFWWVEGGVLESCPQMRFWMHS